MIGATSLWHCILVMGYDKIIPLHYIGEHYSLYRLRSLVTQAEITGRGHSGRNRCRHSVTLIGIDSAVDATDKPYLLLKWPKLD